MVETNEVEFLNTLIVESRTITLQDEKRVWEVLLEKNHDQNEIQSINFSDLIDNLYWAGCADALQ